MATHEGSLITIPFPLTLTKVFAVPRSIPISRENKGDRFYPNRDIYSIPNTVFEKLKEIYRRVDRETEDLSYKCKACGQCCHFVKWGHQLWVTQLELGLIVERARPLSLKKKGVCPYLDEDDGLCRVHSVRALGCRVFSCDLDKDVIEDLHERHFNEIVKLIKDWGLELYYGELLESLENLKVFG